MGRRFSWLLLVLFALPSLAPAARAEDDDLGAGVNPFLIRDTNAARFAVEQTRKYLDSGRTLQAVEVAQRVLDEMPDAFYRLERTARSTRWRLAAEEIRDLLAGLDARRRAVYEEMAAPSAGPLLEQALGARDRNALKRIVDRFGASSAGLRAAQALAESDLERGRGRDAANWAREALRFHPQSPGLWVRLIDALALAGDRAGLEGLAPPEGIRLRRGHEVVDARALQALRVAGMVREDERAGRPMWGGAPDRGRGVPYPSPRPSSMRWQHLLPFPGSHLDREYTRGIDTGEREEFLALWERYRPYQPVAVGRTVYVSDGRSVHALDMYSGRPRWVFSSASALRLGLVTPGVSGQGRTNLARAYSPTVWRDLVIATVEVDQPYDPERLQSVEISTYIPLRKIIALDRHTGEVRWETVSGVDRLRGTPLSIVSPVLVAEDLVVAVGTRYAGDGHNIVFAAYDAATGERRWEEPLGWGQQELNLFGNQVKELAASPLAFSDGVVYASTGIGFAGAVEIRTGRPLWIASYEIQRIEPVQYWFKAPLRFPRVAATPPIVRGDLVFFFPPDGLHIYAMNRHTGELVWRQPYPRAVGGFASLGHVIGTAHDGRREVLLVTGDDLEAFDIRDGSTAWKGLLHDESGGRAVPVGQGIVADGVVLVPTDRGLSRFSVAREGSFEGRDPWPMGVEPGNLLPLPQVLLVSTRDRIAAFYSWEEIERDVAARRADRPNDATILLDAGDIYRLGDALERARDAYTEALVVAERAADEASRSRARSGIFETWLAESRLHRGNGMEALAALERALEWADAPRERIDARIEVDGLLDTRAGRILDLLRTIDPGSPDRATPAKALEETLDRRVTNLERLAEESVGLRAATGDGGTTTARSVALLRLAQLQLDRERPTKAVEALSRVLADPDSDEAVRTRARERIDDIRRVWGEGPYEHFEAEARNGLEAAVAADDVAGIARVLRRYPNASIVPEALFELGRRRIAEDRVADGAGYLRRMLRETPRDPRAAAAAALLADAYQASGRHGARRFVLSWLAAMHPDTRFEIDGRSWTGLSFLAERGGVTEITESSPGVTGPLKEAHFERVEDEMWGRQVPVVADPGRVPRLALLSDGSRLVAFDLARGKVGFRLEPGSCQRAYLAHDALILALGRELLAVSPDTGETLWERSAPGHIVDLHGIGGQAYALLQDTTGVTGDRTLLAVDALSGDPLWERDLGRDDYRNLQPDGTQLLLRRSRYDNARIWHATLVFDGLTGDLRRTIDLPAVGRLEVQEPLVVGGRLIVAARNDDEMHELAAHDLATGKVAWTHTLPGEDRTCSLYARGSGTDLEVVAVQADGHVTGHRVASGERTALTRIFVGESVLACPFYGTDGYLRDDRLVMMPLARQAPWVVGAWSPETGRLLWDARLPEEARPQRVVLDDAGGVYAMLVSYHRAGTAAQVELRLIDATMGEILQEIEPEGLAAEHGLLSMATGWGSIVVFGRAGAALYTSPDR